MDAREFFRNGCFIDFLEVMQQRNAMYGAHMQPGKLNEAGSSSSPGRGSLLLRMLQ
jgi:hypothetical protein